MEGCMFLIFYGPKPQAKKLFLGSFLVVFRANSGLILNMKFEKNA
jgi:hypothetical protein